MKRPFALALLLAVGCGAPPEEGRAPESNCLNLKLQDNGFSTAKPARVSLFFTVDTCDGEPVAQLTADKFRLLEDSAQVSAFESQQRIRPRAQDMRMYTLLLLDLSGSILRSGDYPRLREAADAFLDRMFAHDPGMHRVGIFAFDGRKELTQVVGFTGERAVLEAGLDSLEVSECSVSADCAAFVDRRTCAGWRCVDDSTNLYGAVLNGTSAVEAAVASNPDIPHRQGALVVFTDGTDQAARVSRDAAVDAVNDTRARVFTVGLGGEIDKDALEDFGKDGFFTAQSADTLSESFGEVATRLTSLAQRHYVLEYCSPKRSGKHSLEVIASLERGETTLTGSLTANFDATGFESGCDLSAP
ncbi:MAG: hypothetical protein WBV82_08715 [Myxococcaceae bacterium]